MSALPNFTMRELLDAGVHFGHKTMRWNPRMKPFIFGVRNNIHILDLQQTVPMLYRALQAVEQVIKNNGRVLFVGTKRQASPLITEQAKRCGQYYVNHRWLGGMLTNWNTISGSIRTLETLEAQLKDKELQLAKKERLKIERECKKLEQSLGGIREMGGLPDLLFVVDTNKEKIAVDEANVLGIPVIAIVDSNSNPDNITYPVPGNDDATRAISLYCRLIADAALHGIEQSLARSSGDLGALEQGLREKLPANDAGKPKAKKAKKTVENHEKARAASSDDSATQAKEQKAKKPAAIKKEASNPAVKAAPAKKDDAEAAEKAKANKA